MIFIHFQIQCKELQDRQIFPKIKKPLVAKTTKGQIEH